METLATPGTPISRGRIFQRARTDISTADTLRDDNPIMATRLAEANGWLMIGGLPTLASATTSRENRRLVPRAQRILRHLPHQRLRTPSQRSRIPWHPNGRYTKT